MCSSVFAATQQEMGEKVMKSCVFQMFLKMIPWNTRRYMNGQGKLGLFQMFQFFFLNRQPRFLTKHRKNAL